MNFVTVDRETPMLLPMDMREWIHDDHIVHFIIEAVESVEMSKFQVSRTGSGKAQYPPHMMLSLLIYCYTMGIFSSRKIQAATARDIYVRYLSGNTHPDHDTICKFRRENFKAISECFLQVLLMAKELKLLKLGSIAVDGTHIKANASKDKNVTFERAEQLEQQLAEDIKDLMNQAEAADNAPEAEQKLPEELKRRETLRAKMAQAKRDLTQRAKARAEAERPDFEAREKAHQQRGGRGRAPQAPKETTDTKEQHNMTDSDSRVMRKHKQGTTQSYNPQIAVDAGGSNLIVSQHVSQCSADSGELEPALKNIPEQIGAPSIMIADCGYCKREVIERLEKEGYDLYVSTKNEAAQNQRKYEFRPKEVIEKKERKLVDPVLVKMREKLATEEGRRIYAKRQGSVEPVFGIIKQAMGFRQFLLRGQKKVEGEWNLVTLSYNVKRLFNLKSAAMLAMQRNCAVA